jgi:putative hydrolase of the HAD superfamily
MQLLIDGDDTLWENNVHFERAVEEFIDRLQHSRLSRGEVRAVLDDIERLNLPTRGYGSRAFALNLRQAYLRLAERAAADHELDAIEALGHRVREQPLELIAGVTDTLDALADRHTLRLLTKGHRDEQLVKVEASGLRRFFAEVVVVAEKEVSTYRDIVAGRSLDPGQTWMVGNSPRSDINPALAAGLGAVYVPHPATWRLEHEELASGARLLVLESFRDLTAHF